MNRTGQLYKHGYEQCAFLRNRDLAICLINQQDLLLLL